MYFTGWIRIYKGKKYYPTFVDLDKLLKKEYVRGREILWMSSIKRVMASLTFTGILSEILNVRYHRSLEYLLNENVIIEMDNLATIEKIFLVEVLLLWIYEFRKNVGKRESFEHCIIIEEAHHVLSKHKEKTYGEETIIETIIRMIREMGVGIIVIDQEPGKISDSVLANTNCKICFSLGNGIDISTMAASMNMTNQEKRMIDKLQTGHAIVKLKDRFNNLIHIQIPLIPVKKGLIKNNRDKQ